MNSSNKYTPAIADWQDIMEKSNIEESCRQHMAKNGLELPEYESIIPDGSWHRYSADSNQNKTDECYIASINEFGTEKHIFRCTYSSWSMPEVWYTYNSVDDKSSELSGEERKDLKKASKQHKILTEKRIKEQHDIAAKTAEEIWANALEQIPPKEGCLPSYEHFPLYAQKKGIIPYEARYCNNPYDKRGSVVIAIRNIDGEIRTIQYIWVAEDGSVQKRFLAWGEKKGNFHLPGSLVDGKPIHVCEGHSTECSIFEAKEGKESVVAALDAGNIAPVVENLKKRYPNSPITIAADNDVEKPQNTGLEAAREAAQKFGCKTTWPIFPEDKRHGDDGKPYTDFNDLHCACGLEEVKIQLKRTSSPKPIINLDDESRLDAILDAAEKSLADNQECGIFQRLGALVRIIKVPDPSAGKESGKIKRDVGSSIIKRVDRNFLVEQLTKSASFQKHIAKSSKAKALSCPPKYADHLLSRGEWQWIPCLTGIINTPVILPDGQIIQTPGLDRRTGLFFDPNGTIFDKIPDNPSKDDALQEMKSVEELIKDFPFVSEVDKSVAISSFFSAALRPGLKTAPIFAFTAPSMANGKSLLCDAASIIGTGKSMPKLTYAGNPEEDTKFFATVLEGGDTMVCWDNVTQPFGFPALDTATTEASCKVRRLGSNDSITIDNIKTSFFVNGNNLRIKGDATTRALLCRLDAQRERPEERAFVIEDLRKHLLKNRNEIVHAIPTAVKAYLVSGDHVNLKPFGRFEEWSKIIRETMVWLGYSDPCLSRDEIDDADPEQEAILDLLVPWHNYLGNVAIKVSDLIKAPKSESTEKSRELLQALISTSSTTSKDIDPRALGSKLKAWNGRRVGGYVLTVAHKNKASTCWAVETYQESASLTQESPETNE